MRVTIELGGEPVEFRLPDVPETWAILEAMPLLPDPNGGAEDVLGAPPAKTMADSARDALRNLKATDLILSRCAVHPKLLMGCPRVLAENERALDEIRSDDRVRVATDLMARAGYSVKEAEKASPFEQAAAVAAPEPIQ